MDKPIWQLSAAQTAAAIRGGALTSVEATEAHLARMSEVNPTLNAVVHDMTDSALETAHSADRAQAAGLHCGPMHGVPITVKQNVDVAGTPNINGVPAFADLTAPADAPVVANLRRAGAVILGQTNTPEFSMRAFTDNPVHGLTLNPWSREITCGGSSGGAAAAVAAGIGTLAHGNDIGGSLRWPAYCCGLATIRPTQGRIPAFNPSLASERPFVAQLMSTQGPIARDVADTRLGLQVMAAHDPRDPLHVPMPMTGAPQPRRVAMAPIYDDMDADPGIVAIYAQAAGHLRAAGYTVDEIEMPDVAGTWQAWADLLFAEMCTLSEDSMRTAGSEAFNRVLDAFKAFSRDLDLKSYMLAQAERLTRLRAWLALLEEYPVILSPLMVQRTPGPRGDLDGADAMRRLMQDGGRYMGVMNYLGLPSVVVPVDVLDAQPVGVQLTATRFREDTALAAAQAVEDGAGTLMQRLWAQME
ncbi:amidase [Lutimaribacter sp. EGI FJ00015]|uniref:Amidase n=1 Tax=Lutimaribacter degradans TaxID=2945989 RepID=A0ACC5ZRS2_9RHOB|nr:amidase [Lutimaribacter sp. EGI FJ00013]MCM2561019.1 amidase [Lutimaribacter sp. EGI FJ00013]MCO0612034.1 amidase [Lutimaribacter sp. EGI FJ00015]MCO0634846.1 amidase [Lutimaribacter sp. EGI FJ00014]